MSANPAKRKVRSPASNSANLPAEKRTRDHPRAKISISDRPPGMAADLNKKVDLILAKLEKLDVTESRLNNMRTSIASLEEAPTSNLEKDVMSLKTKTKNNKTGVNNLKERADFRLYLGVKTCQTHE